MIGEIPTRLGDVLILTRAGSIHQVCPVSSDGQQGCTAERHTVSGRAAAVAKARSLLVPPARLSGHEKPILSNRSSKLPIEPVEMGLDTVCINSGQMVRKRFPDHSGP